jgi:putative transposase
MVVGWQLADHMRTTLVIDALTMAITGGHAPPGAVFHSEAVATPQPSSTDSAPTTACCPVSVERESVGTTQLRSHSSLR